MGSYSRIVNEYKSIGVINGKIYFSTRCRLCISLQNTDTAMSFALCLRVQRGRATKANQFDVAHGLCVIFTQAERNNEKVAVGFVAGVGESSRQTQTAIGGVK